MSTNIVSTDQIEAVSKLLKNYDFDVLSVLGKGGFGVVYKCRCLKSNSIVAIKTILKADAQRLGTVTLVINEVAIHSLLHHDYIVELLDYFEDEKYIFLVMEMCNGGNVFSLMKSVGHLPVSLAGKFTFELLSALNYLHSEGLMHRDLKLSNLLLNNDSVDVDQVLSPMLSDDLSIRLCDFGLSVRFNAPSHEHRTLCGTPSYMAPEVQQQQPHTAAADIFSVGCLLYSMLVGSAPLKSERLPRDQVKDAAAVSPIVVRLSPDYTSNMLKLPVDAQKLIRRLMHENPNERPSASEALMDEFFSNLITDGGSSVRSPGPVRPPQASLPPVQINGSSSSANAGIPLESSSYDYRRYASEDSSMARSSPPVVSEKEPPRLQDIPSAESSNYERNASLVERDSFQTFLPRPLLQRLSQKAKSVSVDVDASIGSYLNLSGSTDLDMVPKIDTSVSSTMQIETKDLSLMNEDFKLSFLNESLGSLGADSFISIAGPAVTDDKTVIPVTKRISGNDVLATLDGSLDISLVSGTRDVAQEHEFSQLELEQQFPVGNIVAEEIGHSDSILEEGSILSFGDGRNPLDDSSVSLDPLPGAYIMRVPSLESLAVDVSIQSTELLPHSTLELVEQLELPSLVRAESVSIPSIGSLESTDGVSECVSPANDEGVSESSVDVGIIRSTPEDSSLKELESLPDMIKTVAVDPSVACDPWALEDSIYLPANGEDIENSKQNLTEENLPLTESGEEIVTAVSPTHSKRFDLWAEPGPGEEDAEAAILVEQSKLESSTDSFCHSDSVPLSLHFSIEREVLSDEEIPLDEGPLTNGSNSTLILSPNGEDEGAERAINVFRNRRPFLSELVSPTSSLDNSTSSLQAKEAPAISAASKDREVVSVVDKKSDFEGVSLNENPNWIIPPVTEHLPLPLALRSKHATYPLIIRIMPSGTTIAHCDYHRLKSVEVPSILLPSPSSQSYSMSILPAADRVAVVKAFSQGVPFILRLLKTSIPFPHSISHSLDHSLDRSSVVGGSSGYKALLDPSETDALPTAAPPPSIHAPVEVLTPHETLATRFRIARLYNPSLHTQVHNDVSGSQQNDYPAPADFGGVRALCARVHRAVERLRATSTRIALISPDATLALTYASPPNATLTVTVAEKRSVLLRLLDAFLHPRSHLQNDTNFMSEPPLDSADATEASSALQVLASLRASRSSNEVVSFSWKLTSTTNQDGTRAGSVAYPDPQLALDVLRGWNGCTHAPPLDHPASLLWESGKELGSDDGAARALQALLLLLQARAQAICSSHEDAFLARTGAKFVNEPLQLVSGSNAAGGEDTAHFHASNAEEEPYIPNYAAMLADDDDCFDSDDSNVTSASRVICEETRRRVAESVRRNHLASLSPSVNSIEKTSSNARKGLSAHESENNTSMYPVVLRESQYWISPHLRRKLILSLFRLLFGDKSGAPAHSKDRASEGRKISRSQGLKAGASKKGRVLLTSHSNPTFSRSNSSLLLSSSSLVGSADASFDSVSLISMDSLAQPSAFDAHSSSVSANSSGSVDLYGSVSSSSDGPRNTVNLSHDISRGKNAVSVSVPGWSVANNGSLNNIHGQRVNTPSNSFSNFHSASVVSLGGGRASTISAVSTKISLEPSIISVGASYVSPSRY